MKAVHHILAFASSVVICFTVHAHAVTYYVNDASTAGDQWCSTPGDDANSGTSPAVPKRTLQAVLNAYDLEPGDNVHIDTGYYLLTANVQVSSEDGGASNSFVTLQGSTNGTVIDRGADALGNHGITLDNVQYVRLADLLLTNGFRALYLTNAEYCSLDRVTVRSAADVGVHLESSDHNRIRGLDVSGCKDGVYLFRSSFNSLFDSLIWSNRGDGVYLRDAPSGTSVDSCTIAFNGYKQIDLTGAGTFVRLSNSIVVAQGKGNYCISAYEGYPPPGYIGDYNNLWATDGASIGGFEYEDAFFYRLGNWQKKTGWDTTSLSCDPLFADPGTGDFHLKSTQGRYIGGGIWTADSIHSPCLDSGDPSSDWSFEPDPNGARRNMGAYANTSEASLSTTDPWLHVVNLYSGGQLWGNTVKVQWASWNIPATTRSDWTIRSTGVQRGVLSFKECPFPPASMRGYPILASTRHVLSHCFGIRPRHHGHM